MEKPIIEVQVYALKREGDEKVCRQRAVSGMLKQGKWLL